MLRKVLISLACSQMFPSLAGLWAARNCDQGQIISLTKNRRNLVVFVILRDTNRILILRIHVLNYHRMEDR